MIATGQELASNPDAHPGARPSDWCEKVVSGVAACGPVVMGIDPSRETTPDCFDDGGFWLDSFLEAVVELASQQVAFVKFQSAYYEALGLRGLTALSKAMAKARSCGLGVILDAKRGDIGSTAAAYARAYLVPRAFGGGGDFEADCLTVNPLMGPDTLEPFVDAALQHGKGLFVLCRTSNPGSAWLQDKLIGNRYVSERLAGLISDLSKVYAPSAGLSPIGAVIGATAAAEGAKLRSLLPRSIILAPGLGPQGADPSRLSALRGASPHQLLVPVSRGLLASSESSLTRDAYLDLVRSRLRLLRADLALAALH